MWKVQKNQKKGTRANGKIRVNKEPSADLKRNKVSCAEIIDFSYEALKEVLDK